MMHTIYVFKYSVLLLILNMAFFIQKKTVLMGLISLELLMFMVIMLYIGPFAYFYKVLSFFVAFLCFAAAGAACGLSILITYSRHMGNDLVKAMMYEENPWNSKIIKST
uniref:NADH dehydrogenase subunit 4L n=1 Tax=Aegista aubryana TaxID=1789663 RepID=A0A120HY98_9EUPU|nr:NADH dehydrogenase subunit 4L [Aegista aubryana]AMB49884.1 NADH dehydrogenase subunit 4L [Aegista aubryana]